VNLWQNPSLLAQRGNLRSSSKQLPVRLLHHNKCLFQVIAIVMVVRNDVYSLGWRIEGLSVRMEFKEWRNLIKTKTVIANANQKALYFY